MAVVNRLAAAFSPPPSRIRSPLMDMKGFSSSSKAPGQYENFTFIQEDPTLPNQRKKPRTLTACDRCRARKVKCEQAVSSEKCDACLLARHECSFKARDQRFHHSTPANAPPPSSSPQADSVHPSSRQERKDEAPLRGDTPSPPSQRIQSRFGNFVQSLKRSPSAHGRRPAETAGMDAASSGAPIMSRAPRPLSHVATSPTARQIQGVTSPTMMSPSSPPLSPVNAQAAPLLFDYPLHPTFPRRDHMPVLISGFFEHFGAFMPFLNRSDITQRAAAGRLWNIHALAIAALASRFSTLAVHASEPRSDYSATYLNMAKPLITQYKGQLTLQALQGLVILSWAECGMLQEASHDLPMPSVISGSPQFYISEAVRAARALRLGFMAAVDTFGVPRAEVLATFWSLMLIDELVAWNNSRPALLERKDFDYVLPITASPAEDAFYQVSALSLQRRKVGCALFASNATPGGIGAAVEGMESVYADIHKNRPLLEFSLANLQNSLRRGQVSTYLTLHVLYHSALIRVGIHGMSGARYPLGNDKDPAVVGARSIIDLVRWCNTENRSQAIIDNIFIETPLYEAGQVLSLASAAMASAALGSEFYLNEINDVQSTLRALSSFWATASFKVASFSMTGEQSYDLTSSSLSPVFTSMSMGSPRGQSTGHSYDYPHASMSPPIPSPSLYAPGWHHQAGSSPYHSPHLHATSPTGEAYYDQQTYMGGTGRSRPASPHSGQVQQNPYWQYPR